MPLRDYLCLDCGHTWEEFIRNKEDVPDACIHCDSQKIESQLARPGGYSINGVNSASTTPRSAGSFKRGK